MSDRTPSQPPWWAQAAPVLARTVPTPFYVASVERLRSNLTRAADSLAGLQVPARVAYSVKSNYLSTYIQEALSAGGLIEVVSHHEFDYVLGLGVPPEQVIVNGPAKTRDFVRAVVAAGSRMNLDSLDEARWMVEDAPGVPVGIRVAATLANGRVSRFGVDPDDDDIISELRSLQQDGLNVAGLHIHHSSRRDADSYGDRVRLLARFAERIQVTDLRWLDIGGGFSSDVPEAVRAKLSYPISTWEQTGAAIVSAMRECFPVVQPELIIEPGIGVLADTMAYVMSVAVLKGAAGSRVGVVDGTMFEVNPLRSAIPAPAELIRTSDVPAPAETVPFYGMTCMEIDTFGEVECPSGVATGDLLVVYNVGAYALCLAPDFIVPKATVVSSTGDRLRAPQSRGKLGEIA